MKGSVEDEPWAKQLRREAELAQPTVVSEAASTGATSGILAAAKIDAVTGLRRRTEAQAGRDL